jgi:DNA-binding NarL/FixJ family response regulator
MDQFTLSTMQEIYQIKKRLKTLEEELLMSEEDWIKPSHAYSKQEKIFLLYKQGWSNEQIAKQIGLPIEEVKMIIQRMLARNEK